MTDTHPLLRWRCRRKLSQGEAAQYVGVTQQDWSRYERGRVLPRRDVYRRIIAHTGVSAGAIVKAFLRAAPLVLIPLVEVF